MSNPIQTVDTLTLPGLSRGAFVNAWHGFVDETRKGAYIVCVVLVPPRQLDSGRKKLRQLCLPGQRRLHFVKERRCRKGQILRSLVDCEIVARIYVSRGHDRHARAACLEALATESAQDNVKRLVLETVEGLERFDREVIFHAINKVDSCDMTYEHQRSHEEMWLGAADAIAWAYGAGGEWRTLVNPIVERVVRIDV